MREVLGVGNAGMREWGGQGRRGQGQGFWWGGVDESGGVGGVRVSNGYLWDAIAPLSFELRLDVVREKVRQELVNDDIKDAIDADG